MAMMSTKSSTLERPAVPFLLASAPSARAVRSIWQFAASLTTLFAREAIAAYRRWDAHQRRVIDVAAERDNVHQLFPRVQ